MATRPRILCRADLVRFVLDRPPVKAVERAGTYGSIENLGRFFHRPISTYVWIVRFRSEHGREWLVRVAPNGLEFTATLCNEVEWADWVGCNNVGGCPESWNLDAGDNPDQAALLRDAGAVEYHAVMSRAQAEAHYPGYRLPGTLRVGDENEGTVKV